MINSNQVFALDKITSILYVDGDRTDTYIEDGTETKPFKTITSALAVATDYSTIKVKYSNTGYNESFTISQQSLLLEGYIGGNILSPDILVYNQPIIISGLLTITGSGSIIRNLRVDTSGASAILCDNNNLFQIDNCEIDGIVSMDSTTTQCFLFVNNSYVETLTGTGTDNHLNIKNSFIGIDITGAYEDLNIENSNIVNINSTITTLKLIKSLITTNLGTATTNIIRYSKIDGNIVIGDTLSLEHSEVIGSVDFTSASSFSHIASKFDRTSFINPTTETQNLVSKDIFYDNTTSGLTSTNVQDSIDEIVQFVSYSTSEIDTGKKWIDTKQVYQKVIDFGALPDSTTKTVAHGISTIETLINTSIIGNNTTSHDRIIVPTGGNIVITNQGMKVIIDNTNINITSYIDYSDYNSCYVILEYTKV